MATSVKRWLLLLLLALGLSGVLPAQPGKQRDPVVFDLQQRYDLWPSDGKVLVQDVMTLDPAKAKYPACFSAWEREHMAKGMTMAEADTWVMGMTLFEAAYFDALWSGAPHSTDPSSKGRGDCLSRNKIIIPAGAYYTRDKLDYAFNDISGVSNSSNYEPTGQGGTEIKLWNEMWRGDPEDRVLMGWYMDGSTGVYSYAESVQIHDLHLTGNAGDWKDPAYTITGLRAWSFGSGSNVRNLFISHCDIGLDCMAGTPFTGSGYIGVFCCNMAGIAITGGAGATLSFQTVESDDCPTLFLIRPGTNGAPSGAMLNVQTTKIEWGISPGRTYKPEAIVVGEGWLHLNFGSISYAVIDGCLDALFNLDPDVNASFLHVGDLRVFAASHVQALLHDDVAKKTWLYDIGWFSRLNTFDWSNIRGEADFRSWPGKARVVHAPHQGRLGGLPFDRRTGKCVGAFDRDSGKPTWSDITGDGGEGAP